MAGWATLYALWVAILTVIEDKKVELEFIAGEYNPADLLMKNLANIKFAQFRNELGLKFYSD
ncbi:hypothetical protein AMATHDRAFT_11539 [Amanita thiersii Skay4041]|uniref:Uncharacterized protein n=1 Tax=Amanita thiersii Skay4041 TaxID=703135 RepID=A0A2A9N7A5_9AGAR|nr:hypothetical protein AMATHDRAFT_11539 [Amanita thiersii Skay4041]